MRTKTISGPDRFPDGAEQVSGTIIIRFVSLLILAVTILALSRGAPALANEGAAYGGAQDRDIDRERDRERIALVIGNSNYRDAPLANPIQDARVMKEALEKVGFQVNLLIDEDQKTIKRAIQQLGQDLRAASKDAIGFFYFAGHGIQSNGVNYLIPLNAEITTEADLEIEAVDANWVLRYMEQAGNSINFLVLDACRNNPLERSFRSATRGLARMRAPTGSVIVYATRPGDVALDDSDFAGALAEEIQKPGVATEEMLRNVGAKVYETTRGRQQPYVESSLIVPFYFAGPPEETTTRPAEPEIDYRVGMTFRDCPNCLEMVVLPAGRFTMGAAPDEQGATGWEQPTRIVTLSEKIAMSKYEVTWDHWDRCVADGFCRRIANGPVRDQAAHPVSTVRWRDITGQGAQYRGFLEWLNAALEDKPYRLPSEAEWEYAARAGAQSRFAWGDEDPVCLTDAANGAAFSACQHSRPIEVGRFQPNGFGLYDMHGNVEEWVQDCWHPSYRGAPRNGSAWMGASGGECSRAVVRGGAWNHTPALLRSADRNWAERGAAYDSLGFRVVRDLPR